METKYLNKRLENLKLQECLRDLDTEEKQELNEIKEIKKQLALCSVVGQSEQLVLFARFISNNSKLTTWMTSEELLAEFKKQN